MIFLSIINETRIKFDFRALLFKAKRLLSMIAAEMQFLWLRFLKFIISHEWAHNNLIWNYEETIRRFYVIDKDLGLVLSVKIICLSAL